MTTENGPVVYLVSRLMVELDEHEQRIMDKIDEVEQRMHTGFYRVGTQLSLLADRIEQQNDAKEEAQ